MTKTEQFFNGAYKTQVQEPCVVTVGKRRYKVRQIAQAVRTKIYLLELEAQVLDVKGKQGVDIKEGARIAKKLQSLHAKKAAYYLLGNWAIFIKPIWSIAWRILQLRGSETTFRINEAGAVNPELGFSSANWELSKQERGLYMRLVGDVAQQTQERLESVMNMLEKDALGIKEEDK